MSRSFHGLTLLAAAAMALLVASAAQACPMLPLKHAWTVAVGGRFYGVYEEDLGKEKPALNFVAGRFYWRVPGLTATGFAVLLGGGAALGAAFGFTRLVKLG